MEQRKSDRIGSRLLPCLLFASLAGIFTALLIFAFKLAASAVIELSAKIFDFVRTDPRYLPLLLLGAALIGFVAALILRIAPNCRGGGIPSSIALLRGLIPFQWIKSVTLLFVSALLSYLGGMPLGNEGPSVQMGTAVGRGTVRCFAKRHPAWDRYIMTGGACAGFAAATGAPLTGILFAFEEAHRRFSPMIFMSAATSVITGSTVMQLLCELTNTPMSLFGFSISVVLPLKFIWVAIAVGLICGILAVFFTKFYSLCRNFITIRLSRLPFVLKTVIVFVAVALIGFAGEHLIGSGHHLIDLLIEGAGVWYLLLLYFGVRAILMVVANNVGVMGGLFVPTLAFGAIVGSLVASASIRLGILPASYYAVIVTVGMASFLSASSRTPITAIAFAGEALCGLSNLLPIIAGVTISYLVIEALGVTAFNDTVIEAKVEETHRGKKSQIADAHMTVQSNAFVIGKEIRDILWPPTCVILSVDKAASHSEHTSPGIQEGDVLHLHYQTFSPSDTMDELEALLGAQNRDSRMRVRFGKKNSHVPEL